MKNVIKGRMAWAAVSGSPPASFIHLPRPRIRRVLVYTATCLSSNKKLENVRDQNRKTELRKTESVFFTWVSQGQNLKI